MNGAMCGHWNSMPSNATGWSYERAKEGEEVIMKRKEEKDLGVVIQDAVSPERHLGQQFRST